MAAHDGTVFAFRSQNNDKNAFVPPTRAKYTRGRAVHDFFNSRRFVDGTTSLLNSRVGVTSADDGTIYTINGRYAGMISGKFPFRFTKPTARLTGFRNGNITTNRSRSRHRSDNINVRTPRRVRFPSVVALGYNYLWEYDGRLSSRDVARRRAYRSGTG